MGAGGPWGAQAATRPWGASFSMLSSTSATTAKPWRGCVGRDASDRPCSRYTARTLLQGWQGRSCTQQRRKGAGSGAHREKSGAVGYELEFHAVHPVQHIGRRDLDITAPGVSGPPRAGTAPILGLAQSLGNPGAAWPPEGAIAAKAPKRTRGQRAALPNLAAGCRQPGWGATLSKDPHPTSSPR